MKKAYIVPEILIEAIVLDDVIATSTESTFGIDFAGDTHFDFEDVFKL